MLAKSHWTQDLVKHVLQGLSPERRIGEALGWARLERTSGKVHVLALGKASGPQMDAFLAAFEAKPVLRARLGRTLCVKKRGFGPSPLGAETLEASHPLADRSSFEGGRRVLAWAASLPVEDICVVLLSGGTSALCELAREGFSEEDVERVHREVLLSGLAIEEANRRRAAVSAFKAGGFASACRTRRVEVWSTVDVPSGGLPIVGSGPAWIPGLTAPSFGSAIRVHEKLADGSVALALAEEWAASSGTRLQFTVGETPVPVQGPGKGGRCSDYVVRAALSCVDRGSRGWSVGALATDGDDGNSGGAGGWLEAKEYEALSRKEWEKALAESDTYTALKAVGTAFKTGPTGTNVMDLRWVRSG